LDRVLDKPIQLWTQTDKNRIGRILRANGYERYRERDGERLTWRFKRSTK
jgi:hypothetical protein